MVTLAAVTGAGTIRDRWWRVALTLVLAGTLAVVTACDGGSGRRAKLGEQAVNAPQRGPALHTADARKRMRIVDGGRAAPYNYAPSVMRDGRDTKMWWCSQLPDASAPGDDVLYAQAPHVDGPYSKAKAVFSGTGRDTFDRVHTCDPSVIRVNGTYYLYYTGAADDREHANSIGIAKSTDGVTWRRAAAGEPIASPAMGVRKNNTYGAGQPSVLHLNGWYYLLYTDTSNRSAGDNGAGQFVLRAKDPTFSEHVQGLTDDGFVDKGLITPGNARSIVDAFSADWAYSDALGAFAVAHETKHGTQVTFYNKTLRTQPYQPLLLEGPWKEGPGLVRRPNGHLPVSKTNPCRRVPVDVVRATTGRDAPSGLSHFGKDVIGARGCRTTDRALALLHGYGVVSPRGTVDIVQDGGLVRVQRRSVAEALSNRVLDQRIPALAGAPVLARLDAGAPALRAPGRGLGLRLSDRKLWPVGDPEVARLNASRTTLVDPGRWDAYPPGQNLSDPAG